MANGNGHGWLVQWVAPSVIVAVAGGAAASGYVVGRNQLAERVATLEAGLVAHRDVAAHRGAVSRHEYDADKRMYLNMFSEIKAGIEELKADRSNADRR